MKKAWVKIKLQLYEKPYKEYLSILCLLQVSLFSMVTGGFLIVKGDEIIEQSKTYKLMANLMTMDTWGFLFVISSVLIFVAAFQETKAKFINMLIGGLIGVFVLFLYASASAESQATQLWPIRYGLSACFNLFVSIAGGWELWRMKKIEKDM
ncbi:hypothetical protein Q876_08850 [Listeria monocytogenes]|nr:hypothetical protein [Listeria monocytogenes]